MPIDKIALYRRGEAHHQVSRGKIHHIGLSLRIIISNQKKQIFLFIIQIYIIEAYRRLGERFIHVQTLKTGLTAPSKGRIVLYAL